MDLPFRRCAASFSWLLLVLPSLTAAAPTFGQPPEPNWSQVTPPPDVSWPPRADLAPLATTERPAPQWLQEELAGPLLGRLIVASMLVVSAGCLTLLLLRWTGYGQQRKLSDGVSPQVLGSLRLAPHVGLHMVQFQQHRVLVGVDRGGLKTICVLPESFGGVLSTAEAQEPTAEAVAAQPPSHWWRPERIT